MVKKENVIDLSLTKVPMLRVVLILCLGILLGHWFDFYFVSLIPFFVVFLFVSLLLLQYVIRSPYRYIYFGFLFYPILLLIGVWSIAKYKPNVDLSHFSNRHGAQFVAVVTDDPIYKDKIIRVPVDIKAIVNSEGSSLVQGKLMLTVLRDSMKTFSLNYGDEIVCRNNITEIAGQLNPNEFNYKRYLQNQGTWHQCYLTTQELKVIAVGKANTIVDMSLKWRQKLIRKFAVYIPNDEAYQIAIALIFGYRTEINITTLEAFTDTGTIHILSVSGLHVSLVFGLLTLVLTWMDRFQYGKIYRCFIILFCIWMYVVFTGMSPSILRAGIMISFFIVSTIGRRKQVPLNTLLASAFFILLFSPYYLFDVGFQLSYSAMLGIILLYPFFKRVWVPQNRWFRVIVEYCYISMAAQLFTLPLALYYFGQFPVYFLLANLFIAIPSTLIMYAGIALAFIPFSSLAYFLGNILDWLLTFSLSGLKFIAHMPMAVYEGILWDEYQAMCLFFILGSGLVAINYRYKRLFFFSSILMLVLIVYGVRHRLSYDNYTGIKVYNVKREVAIAQIDKGRVILFSTLDSMNHKLIQYSVLPDLKRYVEKDLIHFVKLNSTRRSNYELVLNDMSILVVEEAVRFVDELNADLVLWRKNNRNDINDLLKKFKGTKLIIDGSNSQRTIDNWSRQKDINKAVYLLKNNFAYVWDSQ